MTTEFIDLKEMQTAEDGIRDVVLSRGLGDVYKRQVEKLLRFHIMVLLL